MDDALLALLGDIADLRYDGHVTIMKFTTNWRVGFYTPKEREDISKMAVGHTFAEAAAAAILAEFKE